ncbi:MAG: glycosyltransferase [Proteobacteria bacterium]|nr:glycosyltransferase [Pseudomonadota bacterium]
MRILVPLHSFEPGGSERVALRLARAWRDSGHDVRIVLGRDEGPRPAFADGLDFEVLQRGSFSTAPFETLWMIAGLPARLRDFRPDLIFLPGNSYAVVGAVLKLLMGGACPPLVLKISNDLCRRDMPALGRAFYRLWCRLQGCMLDRFIALTPAMKRDVRRALGVAHDSIAVIDNPVLSRADADAIAALRRATARPHAGRRFLAIGRLAPQKNFALLLRAFARIAGPEDRLAIVGEGGERLRLERLAKQLGIEDRLLMPGHIATPEAWLAGCDVFALSSDYEGLPAVVLEALAAGLPVVATDCSASMATLLENGRLGRLVAPGDVEALAAAMDRPLVPDPARSAAMAARFTVERAAPAYLRLFGALGSNAQAQAQPGLGGAHVSR